MRRERNVYLRAASYLGIVVTSIAPSGVYALDFEAGIGPTIHGRCHMDYCGFATIQASIPVFTRPAGTLFAISATSWGANYRPTSSEDEYANKPISMEPRKPYLFLVFCSKTRPYLFDHFEGKWQATALKPGDDEAIFGATESAYQMYWASCHHFFPKSAYDPLVHKLAPKLGYHFTGGMPEEDDVKEPSDLLR